MLRTPGRLFSGHAPCREPDTEGSRHDGALHHRTDPDAVADCLGGGRRDIPLVGILGFVPGITHNFGDMMFAGHESDAKLLGLFEVSILHNIVHLLFGVIGLAVARTAAASKGFLIGGASCSWCSSPTAC